MPRNVAVEDLLKELKSFAARKGFRIEEVDAYLTETPLHPAALGYTKHIHKDEDPLALIEQ